jgi:hypothetical protein
MRVKFISTLFFILCTVILVGADWDHFGPKSFELAPCPDHGIHRMMPSGFGFVYDINGHRMIFRGGFYKCSCGAILVCEGYPERGGALKRYITPINITGFEYSGNFPESIMHWLYVEESSIHILETNELMGYRFLNR